MTNKEDNNIAREAAKAAALVKATAESTAVALNIEYMQKDISEIKEGIKSLALNQDGKVQELERKYENLSKVVYVISGSLAMLQLGLKFLVK